MRIWPGTLQFLPWPRVKCLWGGPPRAVSQCASPGPLFSGWGHLFVSDGPERCTEDLGRARPNPCVAPGMRINIAQVIAHALLRTKSQLQASCEAPWPGQQGTQFLFLELWSALLVHCWILGSVTLPPLNQGVTFTSLHPMRAGMGLRCPYHTPSSNPKSGTLKGLGKPFKWINEQWEGYILKITLRISSIALLLVMYQCQLSGFDIVQQPYEMSALGGSWVKGTWDWTLCTIFATSHVSVTIPK